jgi:hypothetical protein
MQSRLWRIRRVVLAAGFLLVAFSQPALAQNPVPLIGSLSPDAVAPGGPGFTLTVNGAGFVSGSRVNWNGSSLTTTFVPPVSGVHGQQLTATISAADIATAGTASVTVVNPAPGGGTSNVAYLSITDPTSSASFTASSAGVVVECVCNQHMQGE